MIIEQEEVESRSHYLVFVVLGAAALAPLALALAPGGFLKEFFALVDVDHTRRYLTDSRVSQLRIGLAGAALLAGIVLSGAVYRKSAISAWAAKRRRDFDEFGTQIKDSIRELGPGRDRALLWGLAAVTLIALAVRVVLLLHPITHDEAATYLFFVSRSIWDVISDYAAENNHIFHNVLAWFSTRLSGYSLISLRAPAFLAGIATIPLAYLTFTRILGARAALLGAALCAGAPVMVEYSSRARGYALISFLTLGGLYVATLLKEKKTATGWLAMVLIFSFGAWTIPIMVYPAGVIGVWMLLTASSERRRQLWRELSFAALATALITALLFSPALLRLIFGHYSDITGDWASILDHAGSGELAVFAQQLGEVYGIVASCWSGALPSALIVVLLIGFALGLGAAAFREYRAATLIAATLLWMVPVMTAQWLVPYPRVVYFLFPMGAAVAGFGLVWALERAVKSESARTAVVVAAAIGLAAVPGYTAARISPNLPYCTDDMYLNAPDMVERVFREWHEGDVVVVNYFGGLRQLLPYYMMINGHPLTAFQGIYLDGRPIEIDPPGRAFVFVGPEDAALREHLGKLGQAGQWRVEIVDNFDPFDLYRLSRNQ